MIKRIGIISIFSFLLSVCLLATSDASAAEYAFPVIGSSNFSNDFDAPRSNGKHQATDIFANKMQKIVSRTEGTITFVGYPQPSWGFAVFVKADNGYTYWYLHINNDSPGTDDGRADAAYAYGPDIQPGNRVVKGQLLGYVGDSGNAEETPPHVHLEVLKPNGDRVNAYDGLKNNSYYIGRSVQTYPSVDDEFLPSSRNFNGGFTLAHGDVNNDGKQELIVGPGEGGKQVKVYDENRNLLSVFEPNGSQFFGGVDVASGDIDGDGTDEIITGAGPGGRYVKIFKSDGSFIGRFQPNGSQFMGGVDVASGDIDGDGTDEIITGARRGGKLVKVFKADGQQTMKLNPYDSKIGVNVAVGNFDNDASDEIVTGARQDGGPRINTYDSDGTMLSSHYVYSQEFKGGVKVEAGNVNTSSPSDEIITISESGGSPRAKITTHTGIFVGYTYYFAAEWWNGHYDLSVSGSGSLLTSMGINRRSTIREAVFRN
jgi:hypothetical protein